MGEGQSKLKIAIILNSKNPETVWNAFRLGATSLLVGHKVKIFLLGEGDGHPAHRRA